MEGGKKRTKNCKNSSSFFLDKHCISDIIFALSLPTREAHITAEGNNTREAHRTRRKANITEKSRLLSQSAQTVDKPASELVFFLCLATEIDDILIIKQFFQNSLLIE